MDDGVIDRAKQYAKENNLSLSKLVEGYLDGLTNAQVEHSATTPLVNSLTGVINVHDNATTLNSKYLKDKYK